MFEPIPAGRLRHRVDIHVRDAAQDSHGQELTTWNSFLTHVAAEVTPLAGRELAAAQAIHGETTHAVVIRFRAGITPAHRVVYQGRVFNVLGLIDMGMRHRYLSLLCSEGLNQG